MNIDWEKYIEYDASILHTRNIRYLGIIEYVDSDTVWVRESEIWANSKTEEIIRGNGVGISKAEIFKVTKKRA